MNAQDGAMRSYHVTTMTVQYAQADKVVRNEQRDRSIIRSLRSRTNAQSGAMPHAMSTTMTVAVICRDAVIIAADAVIASCYLEQRDRSIIQSLRSRTNAQSGAIPHAMSTSMTVQSSAETQSIAADAVYCFLLSVQTRVVDAVQRPCLVSQVRDGNVTYRNLCVSLRRLVDHSPERETHSPSRHDTAWISTDNGRASRLTDGDRGLLRIKRATLHSAPEAHSLYI